jgi:hypothetical protein
METCHDFQPKKHQQPIIYFELYFASKAGQESHGWCGGLKRRGSFLPGFLVTHGHLLFPRSNHQDRRALTRLAASTPIGIHTQSQRRWEVLHGSNRLYFHGLNVTQVLVGGSPPFLPPAGGGIGLLGVSSECGEMLHFWYNLHVHESREISVSVAASETVRNTL